MNYIKSLFRFSKISRNRSRKMHDAVKTILIVFFMYILVETRADYVVDLYPEEYYQGTASHKEDPHKNAVNCVDFDQGYKSVHVISGCIVLHSQAYCSGTQLQTQTDVSVLATYFPNGSPNAYSASTDCE
ncbi:hypothetical protein ILUMI_18487 [Ignelater luminosus]|uniref:Uncharacterized protein n=1 Tax=Ignelater luminosus TaxID=2038154 RepID=A0A8K0G6I1_IGNLU|nr:hypothetical protein ILUMI_18487 [Ignelater luminosus]